MNRYKAYFNRLTCELEAPTTFEAQKLAQAKWSVPERNRYKIAIALIETEAGKKLDPVTSIS